MVLTIVRLCISSMVVCCLKSLDTLAVLQNWPVYAIEFSHRSGRDLVNMAKKRTNLISITEDVRYPARYWILVGMVDAIFSDVAQPDQVFLLFPCNLVSDSLVCHIVELRVVYPYSLPLCSFHF